MDLFEATAIVAELGRALNRHDARAAGACYAPDALYREIGTGLTVRGRAAVETVTQEVLAAFPDARFGVDRVVPGRGTLVVEWWAEGTYLRAFRGIPPTGERMRLQAASVLRCGQGLILEETVYLNASSLLRQALAQAEPEPAVVERYLEAVAGRDPVQAAACFAPLGWRHLVGGGRARGRAAIARQWQAAMAAAPGWRLVPERIGGGSGRITAEYRVHAGPGHAGLPVLSVFRIRGGAILAETVYADWPWPSGGAPGAPGHRPPMRHREEAGNPC